MDSLFNSDVNAGKKAPKFKVFVILLVLFLLLISLVSFIFFKPSILDLIDKISGGQNIEETPTEYSPFANLISEQVEESTTEPGEVIRGVSYDKLVRKTTLTYEHSLADGSPIQSTYYYVFIRSSGDVYTRTVNVGDDVIAKLFILKGELLSMKPVDAVVAISLENSEEEHYNFWLGNIRNPESGVIEDISEPPFEESKFESIFKQDSETRWRYSFYDDYSTYAPDWYVDIVEKVYEGTYPKYIMTDVADTGFTNLLLFPRMIYEEI